MRLALTLAFLIVPLLEIYIVIQVGQVIGAPWTVALLLFESLLGAWIVKREGTRAWRSLRGGLGFGRMPSSELLDAALILVGGTLLLTPGFLTDVLGFFLILPFTRPLARRAVGWFLARRVETAVRRMATGTGAPTGSIPSWGRGPRGRGRVVSGEVVDPDPRHRP